MSENKKVLLVSIDGLRPDAIEQSSHPFLKTFMKEKCAYTDKGRSVTPSVTLPCHMSMFTSMEPCRHGTSAPNNIYNPPVHPVDGLFEVLKRQKKTCYFFYTWEQLRDLGRPGSLDRQELCRYYTYGAQADCEMCDRTIQALQDPAQQPDFMFFYTGNTDEVGHKYGWMGKEYLAAVDLASKNVERLVAAMPEDYTLVITADHGGHDRTHGTEMPEDMTIPMMIYGPGWEPGPHLDGASLLDLAPTIADIIGVEPSEEWDGKSLRR